MSLAEAPNAFICLGRIAISEQIIGYDLVSKLVVGAATFWTKVSEFILPHWRCELVTMVLGPKMSKGACKGQEKAKSAR
jgi:hypothetical protein